MAQIEMSHGGCQQGDEDDDLAPVGVSRLSRRDTDPGEFVKAPAKQAAPTARKGATPATVDAQHLAAALADCHDLAENRTDAVLGDFWFRRREARSRLNRSTDSGLAHVDRPSATEP